MKSTQINSLLQRDPISLFNWFMTSNTNYLNIPYQIVMNKVIPLTLGEGVLFEAEDEKITNFLNQWADKNKFYQKCKLLMAHASLTGKGIAFLLKNKAGELDFYIPTYPQMSSISRVNEIEKLAVIWTNLNKSDSPSFAKITIGEGTCVIQNFGNPSNLMAQDAQQNEKDLTPIGRPIIIKTNEKFFPVFEFVNKRLPDFGFQNSTYYSGTPDWFPGRKLLFDIEDALEQKYKERKKNQTRVFGEFSEQTINDMKKSNNKLDIDDFIGDFIVQAALGGYTKEGANIDVIQGDPNLAAYHEDIDRTLKLFYETAGYNRGEDNKEQYENKTKSILSVDLDTQTTLMKKKELMDGLYRLLDIVLEDANIVYKEKDVRNYSVNFVSSSIVEKVQKMDLVERRLATQTLSRVEAVQMLDNVSSIVARKKIEEIDKENDIKAEKEMALEQQGQMMGKEENSKEMSKEVA